MHLRELTIICLKDKQKKAINAFSLHGSIFFPMSEHYVPKGIFPDWSDSVLRAITYGSQYYILLKWNSSSSFIYPQKC